MAKKSDLEPVAQITISVYNDGTIELDHTPNFDLSKRIIALTETLEHQVNIADALNTFDESGNFPS